MTSLVVLGVPKNLPKNSPVVQAIVRDTAWLNLVHWKGGACDGGLTFLKALLLAVCVVGVWFLVMVLCCMANRKSK